MDSFLHLFLLFQVSVSEISSVLLLNVVSIYLEYIEYKDPNIQNYNSAICCMWVRNMVCHIEGRTQADGDGE